MGGNLRAKNKYLHAWTTRTLRFRQRALMLQLLRHTWPQLEQSEAC